ncbi:hypothetical protein DIPPA_20664, partial [Diplonema papillatum]
SNKEYDTKRARLLGFQRLCKLMKKRERAQGNSMVLNGLSGMVLNEAPPMQSSSNTKIPVWYTIDSFPRLQPLQNNWKAIREEAAKAWKRHVTLDLHRPAGAWLGQNADEFISHYMEQEGWIPSYQTKSGRNYKWKNLADFAEQRGSLLISTATSSRKEGLLPLGIGGWSVITASRRAF